MSGSFSENGVASLGVSFEVSGLRMGASIWLIDESFCEEVQKRCTEALAGGQVSCRRSLQAAARCRLSGTVWVEASGAHHSSSHVQCAAVPQRRKAKGS